MFDSQVTFLYAANLHESARFYHELLGLELVLDQGPCQIFRVAGNAFLGVCQCSGERPVSADGVIVTFVSNDVDGWYDKLAAAGVAFMAPPTHNERFNIYHAFFHDPDGYKLEVQQFQDPRWPAA